MRPAAWRAAAWTAAVLALAGAFALYLQPEFLVTLADRVWSCL